MLAGDFGSQEYDYVVFVSKLLSYCNLEINSKIISRIFELRKGQLQRCYADNA